MANDRLEDQKLGKYRIEKKIGVGGMAEIYLASLLTDPGSKFAIKKILNAYAKNEHLVSMLVNEAQVTVSLRHPNVVPIYDFGKVGESYYLAMEYVEGKDLTSLIYACRRAGENIPVEIAIYIMMEMLEGLAYAHGKKDNYNQPLEIVHRDISPQNIMLSRTGHVKILDFGIAKVRGKAAETQAGILKGKFSYMSPEQARGARIDRRTDLFSAGITLYEMVTLENPFYCDSELETLNRVKKANFRNPRLLNRYIPKALEKVIKKSLKKRASARYNWAEDMQKDLFEVQKKVGFASAVELQRFMDRLIYGKDVAKDVVLEEVDHRKKSYRFETGERNSDVFYISQLKKKRRRQMLLVFLVALFVVSGIAAVVHRDKLKDFASKTVDTNKIIKSVQQTSDGNKDDKSSQDGPEGNDGVVETSVPTKELFSAQSVHFIGEAKAFFDRLDFDQYERIRNELTDLVKGYADNKSIEALGAGTMTEEKLGVYVVSFQVNPAVGSVTVSKILIHKN